jgi:chorismate dehydratase
MLKMGKISYTNILPIYYYFNEEQFSKKVRIIPQIPSQLNQQMEKGTIDLGPISSFSYAQNQSSYVLLPQLSVSSKGKVRSIFLFSKKRIEDLQGASIALTSSSATSKALLKVILKHFYRLSVTYETMDPSLSEMMKEHDAALLIGDDAIRARWDENQYPYVYDLGEEWTKHTGQAMTFAVWAVRKEVTETYPTLLAEVYAAFLESKRKGSINRNQMIDDLCPSFGGDAVFWHQYFSGISYDFDQSHIAGLEYFYELAYQVGLLKDPCKVQLWKPRDAVFL